MLSLWVLFWLLSRNPLIFAKIISFILKENNHSGNNKYEMIAQYSR